METYRIKWRNDLRDQDAWTLLCWVGETAYWTTTSRAIADAYCAILNLTHLGAGTEFHVFTIDG